MQNYSEFYSTIDDIVQHMRTDFIGPAEEYETIGSEDPLSRYSVGILWAQPNNKSSETIEDANSTEEMFENALEDDGEFQSASIFKPSSMGVSFAVAPGDELKISFSYAVYRHTEQQCEENGKSINKHFYSREPKLFSAEIFVPDKICNVTVSQPKQDIAVYLHVRKINDDNSKLVTVSVLNKNRTANEFIESSTNAMFQCELSIKSKKGFVPVYRRNIHRSFEEEKNDMLYDSIDNYSYGHGCSSACIEENGIVKEIKSEFIPQYRMLQMMPRMLENTEYLYMKYWGNADRETACSQLSDFIMQYEKWYAELKNNTEITGKYPEPAKNSFANIEKCIKRLYNGVEILQTNDIAWKSFKYMNEAMLIQRIKTKHCPPDSVSWYPFQMAYILQIIPDITDSGSPFHNDVDLLWFPTGGGKTEAYLGLSAFTIFYRRLRKENTCSDGVTIIMRYTLRLLTIQQFERATALICACEHMRNRYNIPGREISIGLWIGSGMTPNHIKDAEEALGKLRENSEVSLYGGNPMQITKCPWCGAEIDVNGYSVKNNAMNISCRNNPECEFHSHLPIYIVDDDIYRTAPTIILSTVDKFARITWEEKAGNLFGANGCEPPELIIQDELHLISGPIGSITGIYEIAVDNICRHYGNPPKIIASTATVKNAENQIKILYNRSMIQFPPNGLSQKDSFFAVEAGEDMRPARTYVGICSVGSGMSEMLIKMFALLTFMKHLYKKQNKPTEVIDQYYTCIGYFNSLKELGSNSIIISDRINSEIKYLAAYKFRNETEKYGLKPSDIPFYLNSNELTSRNSAREIKNILERLTNRFTDDTCFDYIMASNMLSVGIDIERLGIMCVYGQPKSNSEYIQATSRVGRTNPGLVISLYNGMRSRDKSYYEQFDYYHSTFYKYVEATSVTSYSPRAVEKALHCALMAIIRHTIPKYNPNENACEFIGNDEDIEMVKQNILKRVKDIEPRISEYAGEWLDFYLKCWEKLSECLPNRLVFSDYHNEDSALFKNAGNQTGSDIPPILNSVRNVEPSVNIYFIKR
ncbi:MAG: DEAD/DEAH box helicase [Ruminococcus sp.]|nr:DEAD/DEAH box helicase [Ruminococcus sp.]MCM1381138.1 DEAD/DEAH box helicase [Muribaculaceae bacterium]MCM1479170.1 DEAD/DEAH box helicase [Muribaculaceae bacterium]